jgi:hypothetical protein
LPNLLRTGTAVTFTLKAAITRTTLCIQGALLTVKTGEELTAVLHRRPRDLREIHIAILAGVAGIGHARRIAFVINSTVRAPVRIAGLPTNASFGHAFTFVLAIPHGFAGRKVDTGRHRRRALFSGRPRFTVLFRQTNGAGIVGILGARNLAGTLNGAKSRFSHIATTAHAVAAAV